MMREECGGLKEQWYAACLSQELAGKRPLGRTILELPLVLWRTSEGEVAVLEDRCAHRNAPLSKGAVVRGRIGCPYHGWRFDAQGRCASVPSQGPEAAPPVCGVRSFPVREEDGLVWVWMGDTPAPQTPLPMPAEPGEGWGSYWMVTEFANDVTHLVENFMDVPHTNFVHYGWFRKPSGKQMRARIERTGNGVLITYREPDDRIGFWGRILNPDGEPISHTDRFLMPSTTRVDYVFGSRRALLIASTCTPRAPYDTLVFTRIAYRLGWMNWLAPLWLPRYTRAVIQQDVEIMQHQGQTLRHFGDSNFHSTQADLPHEFIESLRNQAVHGGPIPEPRDEEIDFWM